MLRSLEAAGAGLAVQTVVVEDAESRGLPWARNEGLSRATGDVVFFADADDSVRPGFFKALLDALARTGADFVLSSFDAAPLRRDYDLKGSAAVRAALWPAFFGYSFDDVRRWNAGGDLAARREQGSVCRCAFRRDFLERHHLRFDETLFLYEDAPFLAECAAYATRVTSLGETLYDYVPGPSGILATTLGTDRYFAYKFAALANRKAIAARVGAAVLEHFRGSAVFSALELLRARRGAVRYARDPFVAASLASFPLSPRHPLVAAGVTFLRTVS